MAGLICSMWDMFDCCDGRFCFDGWFRVALGHFFFLFSFLFFRRLAGRMTEGFGFGGGEADVGCGWIYGQSTSKVPVVRSHEMLI